MTVEEFRSLLKIVQPEVTEGGAMKVKLNVSPEARDKVVKQLAIYSYAAKSKRMRPKK